MAAIALPIHTRSWPRWPLLLVFWVLSLGPPAAALFIATGIPFMQNLGWLARDLLSTYICPTPLKSYTVFAAPMAVCARCWGATIGLWVGYGLFQRADSAPHPQPLSHKRRGELHLSTMTHSTRLHWFLALPWGIRLLLVLLPFSIWVAEIAYWPTAPYWLLLANGAQAGIGAGLFFCSIWPGLAKQ